MDEPVWEHWLRERFPAYLLRNADGEPRPILAIETALCRLQGTPGALVRLAELGFLLDPEAGVAGFLEELLPRWLERVLPETIRRQDVRHGSLRGRVDWPQTLELRRRSRDASWFVGTRPQRTFATPPLLALRWLLEQILRAIEDIRPGRLEAERGWVEKLSRLHGAANRALAHAALRELPVERPGAEARRVCAHSRDEALRQLARLLDWHGSLLPTPDREALQRTVARYSLVPLDANKRFEIFVLLSVVEMLDRLLPGFHRRDTLILAGRNAPLVLWEGEEGSIELFYDLAVEAGRHREIIRHYFGATVSVRPDVRLVWKGPKEERRELYVDAKNATDERYLVESHLKMLGYIADRPESFGTVGTKVVLVSPLPVTGKLRTKDEVVFVWAGDCGAGGALNQAIGNWLGRTE